MNSTNPELHLPPMAIGAEQSLLGGLLFAGPSAWDAIADVVGEADFYRDDHRRIFGHIRRLVETQKSVDVLTVFDSIERSNETDQTGGLGYLAEIANAVPSAANIASYARTVVEKSRLRGLLAFADDAQRIAVAAGVMSAQERIDEATGKLLALAEYGAAKDDPRPIGECLGTVIDAIEARMARGGAVSGLPTGYADIDLVLDGLKGGDLIIIAGRPSMGKTAFALNVAENVALSGIPALIFSMEMGRDQLVTRSLSSVGQIDSTALASGKLYNDDWDRITVAMGRLLQAPLIIDQSANLTTNQMRARARRQKRKGGLGLIVIDYLQLMSGQGNNRNEELGNITRNLKIMARELNVPVICLSQLSRKVEERADKRPMLSDLRESGSIEQDADVVMMLYRDEYYNPDSMFKGLAEVLVRKNRMGACKDACLVFQPEFSRFRNADPYAVKQLMDQAAEASPKIRIRRGFKED